MDQNREVKMNFVASEAETTVRKRRKTKKQLEMEAAIAEANAEMERAEHPENMEAVENAAEIVNSIINDAENKAADAESENATHSAIIDSIVYIGKANDSVTGDEIAEQAKEEMEFFLKQENAENSADLGNAGTGDHIINDQNAESGNEKQENEAATAENSAVENSAAAEENISGDAGSEASANAVEPVKAIQERTSAPREYEQREQQKALCDVNEKKNYTSKIIGFIVNKPLKFHIPDWLKKYAEVVGQKLVTPLSIMLIVTMIAAVVIFVRNQYSSAVYFLENGPEKAYSLEENGKKEEAKNLWIQINAKMFWYQPFSGFFTNIDQPYLQKASVAYKAEDWQKVAENAYKALQVPITDQQAVYVQQMILQATANMVKAYLPNQAEQPIRGGVPDHAQPVCEPSATYIWVVPAILVLLAGAFLYGRKRILFATMALLMPCYFWFVNVSNNEAIQTCNARLSFNPEHITLYGENTVPLPAFTPTPLRVESVPIKGAAQARTPSVIEQSLTSPKNEFLQPANSLKIETGNAPSGK